MGRPFLQYLGDDVPKYTCASCSCDIASGRVLVWEGIMGAMLEPAVLLRDTVNLEATGDRRSERLSTGRYMLVDVRCKCCATRLGWRYIEAASLEQRYKEGCTLLQKSLLQVVDGAAQARRERHRATQQQQGVAVQC